MTDHRILSAVGPREELRALVLDKVSGPLGGIGPTAQEIADAVMKLFYTVNDDWERIDITTYADLPGERWLDQRYLVARVPRQSDPGGRSIDRTVIRTRAGE